MNELIACSDYDDGICKPTGDVCPLQIEDQHRCVNKQSKEVSPQCFCAFEGVKKNVEKLRLEYPIAVADIEHHARAGSLSSKQVDAAKAEAVKKAIEEYQVETFPALVGLIPETECWQRIDDAVKAETKRVVEEIDRYHTSSTQWLALREKLLGPTEASDEGQAP
jgi:hypothetical protein